MHSGAQYATSASATKNQGAKTNLKAGEETERNRTRRARQKRRSERDAVASNAAAITPRQLKLLLLLRAAAAAAAAAAAVVICDRGDGGDMLDTINMRNRESAGCSIEIRFKFLAQKEKHRQLFDSKPGERDLAAARKDTSQNPCVKSGPGDPPAQERAVLTSCWRLQRPRTPAPRSTKTLRT